MYKTKVICISAKAQHGKDTSAQIMYEEFTRRGCKVLITHHADLLKHMAKTMFGWDGVKDEHGRHILQYIGTDVVRKKEPNFWVDHLISVLRVFDGEWDYVLIPDCRFPNEVFSYKDAGFPTTHVRVRRENFVSPLTEEQQNHISETALDNVEPDIWLINDGSIDDLRKKICDLIATDLD